MRETPLVALVTIAITVGCAVSPSQPPPMTTIPPPSVGTAPPPAPTAVSVKCGSKTCGPDEYCLNQCTCCGAYPAPAGTPSGTLDCKPIPPPCTGVDFCKCASRPYGLCNDTNRSIALPCA